MPLPSPRNNFFKYRRQGRIVPTHGGVNAGDAFRMRATQGAEASTYAAIIRLTRAAAESRTPLRLALQDYVLYLMLTSLIYSVIYTPGQVVSVLGIAVYLQGLGKPATGPAAAPRLFRRDLLALR